MLGSLHINIHKILHKTVLTLDMRTLQICKDKLHTVYYQKIMRSI